jgi:hypothetical protein
LITIGTGIDLKLVFRLLSYMIGFRTQISAEKPFSKVKKDNIPMRKVGFSICKPKVVLRRVLQAGQGAAALSLVPLGPG